MTVLVVGASGFVGGHCVRRFAEEGLHVRAAVHRSVMTAPASVEIVSSTVLNSTFDWRPALAGCETVVHLASRVHVMHDASADPLLQYRQTNVDGTLRLFRQAMDADVRRFVFLSSIKANGESTLKGQPFTEQYKLAPADPYGVSKFEAENGLKELAKSGNTELTILRPPLVYGPGVRANFLSMMKWVYRGVPLPLASIDNRRSLIGVDNLVDLIFTSLNHPAAANETFLVSDGDDLSTPELIRRLAQALGKKARLFPCTPALLAAVAALAGKKSVVERLAGSLQVDITKARSRLGWTPPHSVDEELRRTARWFMESINA